MFNFARSLSKFRDHDSPKLPQPLAKTIAAHAHDTPATAPMTKPSAHKASAPAAKPDFTPFMQMACEFMIISDGQGQITYANDALYDVMMLEPAQKEALSFLKIFHEEDRPHIRNTIQTMRLSADDMDKPEMDFEARLASNDGQDHWVMWQVRGEGDLTYCTGRDITDNKSQRDQISKSEEQLVQAESIGRFGRWQWTIGQEEFEWSDELFRIFGLSADDFTPTIQNIYAMVHEDDQDRMDQTFQRAVINQNHFDVDFCIQRPDGEQRFIRCEGRCKSNHDGEVITLYGIMQDMSERIIYENELRSAKEDAEKACAARTQFLANMSHELRTPLNAIIGFSEMIESEVLGPAGNPKYPEYGTHIRQSGAHLLDLIGDILDMAKIEAGKYDLDTEDVNMHDLLTNAMTMIRPRADEKHLTITQDGTFRDDLVMQLDRRACLQVMLNILSNAVKFTPENGHIALRCEEHNHSIAMTISDNGIGIPATKLASITNPFEQVSSHYTRDHEGSGLGLAITKELVELHGGTLKIKSQIDVGTDVTITLPLSS
ncbi:MAG: PAS domain-containing sensor histidine kinase [Alphaproteobacteria bacterium]|nr:PAS domain-containing sensor histidine kinase [Alphaproteobacteria bacterium]|tara:strand:+ start:6891 stop:8525 length:1635 start_codon:yes stop_codon:yes gene_type:complete